MIKKTLYILFSLQVYILITKYLNISFLKPFYTDLIAAGIAIFIFLLVYVADAGKMFMVLAIFFMNFSIVKFSYLYNIIPFAAFYLYVLSILKERSIFSKKSVLLLSSVVLLGFFNFNWNGILESNLSKRIHNFLYAVPNSSISSNNTKASSGIMTSHPITKSTDIAIQGIKEISHKLPFFQTFLIISVLLVALIIFALFLVKFYQSERKSVFYKTLLVAILTGVSAIAILSVVFFKLLSSLHTSVLKELAKIAPNNVGSSNSALIHGIDIRSLVHRAAVSSNFLSNASNAIKVAGIITTIAVIVLGIALAYFVYKTLFSESYHEEMVFNDSSIKKYKKQIKERGIRKVLDEIENPEEFVKFLYFSVLYLLSEKGFNIKKYETPDEFYLRLTKEIATPILYFKELSVLFDKVKYGNKKITDSDIDFIRSNYKKLLESVKNVEFVKDVNNKAVRNRV